MKTLAVIRRAQEASSALPYEVYDAWLFYDSSIRARQFDIKTVKEDLQRRVNATDEFPTNEISPSDVINALQIAGSGGMVFEITKGDRDTPAIFKDDPIWEHFDPQTEPLIVSRSPLDKPKRHVPLPDLDAHQLIAAASMRFSSRLEIMTRAGVEVTVRDPTGVAPTTVVKEQALVAADENLEWRDDLCRQVGMKVIASCNHAVQTLVAEKVDAVRSFTFAPTKFRFTNE
jgi:hypothetical protein